MVKKATAVVVIIVLSLATACAPAAPTPTPTPEPKPTRVKVLATNPEHLAGTWLVEAQLGGRGFRHYRFEADGTIWYQRVYEDFQLFEGRFWFEDGVYYEESDVCFPIGSYRAYLEIEGGRAVRIRFEVIDDWDRSCTDRRLWRTASYVRVDW
jgi:hypothetical protein